MDAENNPSTLAQDIAATGLSPQQQHDLVLALRMIGSRDTYGSMNGNEVMGRITALNLDDDRPIIQMLGPLMNRGKLVVKPHASAQRKRWAAALVSAGIACSTPTPDGGCELRFAEGSDNVTNGAAV